jgi:hypothetical protein
VKRLVVAVLGAATLLTGCASTVEGRADAATGAAPVVPTTSTTAPSSPPSATERTNLCSLLDWPDLGYPGTEKATGPTKTDTIKGALASCSWVTQEFKAGFTPPPNPACNDDTTSVEGSLSCAGDDAKQFAEIENGSATIEVTIAYLPGQPEHRASTYRQDGRTVYLSQDGDTCGGDTAWDGAAIAAAVTDPSKAYGSPCVELKKVIALLIEREPHH